MRAVGIAGTLFCVWVFVKEPSFPTPDKLVIFASLVFMIFGQTLAMLKRLLPFVSVLLVYEMFRGVAAQLNSHVNYMFMANADKLLGFGQLPTVTMQRWWWHGYVQWYDFVFYITYMLHFVIPIALVLIVWKIRPKAYWRCVMTYVVVSFSGFLTFWLFRPHRRGWLAIWI